MLSAQIRKKIGLENFKLIQTELNLSAFKPKINFYKPFRMFWVNVFKNIECIVYMNDWVH